MADTEAEARAWRALGRQLAASRRAAGLSQQQLAPLSGYTRSTVANAETGRQHVPRTFWSRCDEALGTGNALARGYDQVVGLHREQHVRSAVVAQQARTSLSRTLAPALVVPPDQRDGQPFGLVRVESIRQWLDGMLSDRTVSPASVEAWEEAVLHHGRATRTRPAAEQLTELSADLADLGMTIRQCRSASSLRVLVRVAAHLSGLTCLLFVKLDQRDAFRRWASTARTAAAESGDPATLSWTLAQAAYGHFYSGDLTAAVTTAQQAQALMRRSPFVGAALAAALEARAQASRGRAREARDALGRAESVLAALSPAAVTASAFGYTESQFRFHQGSTYTRLRDTRRALAAQDQALTLCPAADYTDWALTRLDRATCMSQDGDAPAAIVYAIQTAGQLQANHSEGIIALRTDEFVRALPSRYRSAEPVLELQNLLSPVSGAPKEIPGP